MCRHWRLRKMYETNVINFGFLVRQNNEGTVSLRDDSRSINELSRLQATTMKHLGIVV